MTMVTDEGVQNKIQKIGILNFILVKICDIYSFAHIKHFITYK